MNLIVHRKGRERHGLFTKICFITKLAFIILLSACLQVSATGYGQTITLSEHNVPLEQVLKSIERQTDYYFWYKPDEIKDAQAVSVKVVNATIEETLKQCLGGLPFTYSLVDKMVVIKKMKDDPALKIILPKKADTLRGLVANEQDEPLPGASITIKGKDNGTITGSDGHFTLPGIANGDVLIISCIGYERQELKLSNQFYISIKLKQSVNKLDEMQVIAYGTTTPRLNTGSISTVSAEEIARQPVMNPLAALEGRVPGLMVVQSSGMTGSNFSVQLRGRTSINTGIADDPLFIIDGVPFANGNSNLNGLVSSLQPMVPPQFSNIPTGGLSPFSSLNPNDIESITVLKDADATSIYGSRGANGVVLITTKKGKIGKTQINLNIYTGISKIGKTMDMLNTQQYLAMRHQAFTNDGVSPTVLNAPDLLLWDTTRYTDWKQYFIGNTANTTDANLSVSGGNQQTQFFIGGGYHKETTVLPGKMHDNRGSLHFNINHSSLNNKFKLIFSGSYGGNKNTISAYNGIIGQIMNLPPNSPPLFDSIGNLNWSENGGAFLNPMSLVYQTYGAKTDNYVSNISLSYEIARGLKIKSNFGYNAIYLDETSLFPPSTQDPRYEQIGSSQFQNSTFKSLIIEPQIEYITSFMHGKLNILVGATWQQNQNVGIYSSGYGYTIDALVSSLSSASSISSSNDYNQYKYAAGFGRLNYNIQNKYIVNISGRRDGSSRFGPGKKFANFGAVGAGWIFSNENWVKQKFDVLSFGKLRGSYGTSGNDQIGDYKYLDNWRAPSSLTYLGKPGLIPNGLFNPDYSWEVNKKMEFALELGFIKDKILATGSWYRNRTNNQLINYTLPLQTGGTSITANFPATVQNSGFEVTLNTTNIKTNDFEWDINATISIPKNKLVSFPKLSESSYGSTLIVGKPITIASGLLVKDVNMETGLFEFQKEDGTLTSSPKSADKVKDVYNTAPVYFGGIENTIKFKGFSLVFFLDYRKQKGWNYLGNIVSRTLPGGQANFPTAILRSWTPENTNANIQKTGTSNSYGSWIAYRALKNYGGNILFSDASFIRMRNVSLSYNLPENILNKCRVKTCRIYVNAQNLFVLTNYLGGDPETQNINSIPPLRTIAFGLQIVL